MKKFKEISEALPPHLQKFVGGDTVIDRTPSFKQDIIVVVPRSYHQKAKRFLKGFKFSTSGTDSGTFKFTDQMSTNRAIEMLKSKGIKIIFTEELINESPQSYKYVVGFTFGQNMQVSDRSFSYVRTKRNVKWAINKAIEMTVDMAPSITGGQIETKVFKDEDEMADFWEKNHKAKQTDFFGITSRDLL